MKSGITGSVFSHTACTFVASACWTSGLSDFFHWFSRPVALGSEKCSQLPVAVPSWPEGIAGHQAWEQEVDRQRDPEREGVENETTGEPAHIQCLGG